MNRIDKDKKIIDKIHDIENHITDDIHKIVKDVRDAENTFEKYPPSLDYVNEKTDISDV